MTRFYGLKKSKDWEKCTESFLYKYNLNIVSTFFVLPEHKISYLHVYWQWWFGK